MKKIRDERLILQNFKNIRTTLLVENSVILLLLLWQGWQKSDLLHAFTYDNPLFLVLMIAVFTMIVLSLNVSTPIEDKPKRSWRYLGVSALIELVGFYLLTAGHHPFISLLAGVVLTAITSGIMLYSNHLRSRGEQ
jgi:NADH:ubiquinone oxidoreductase subunit 2 (subunit N)